jgi:predicted NBD/HSP70 family sugar kinase
VFAAAARSDAAAQEVVTELTRRLARGVAGFVTALNPELVIVGGGIANAGPALLEPLEAGVRALVPVPPRIELSRLGDESVALGAVRLAADVADASLFPLAAGAAS